MSGNQERDDDRTVLAVDRNAHLPPQYLPAERGHGHRQWRTGRTDRPRTAPQPVASQPGCVPSIVAVGRNVAADRPPALYGGPDLLRLSSHAFAAPSDGGLP